MYMCKSVKYIKLEFHLIKFKISFSTSHDPECIFLTMIHLLILIMKIYLVYFENRMKHVSTLCGQNAEFSKIEDCAVWMTEYLSLVVFLSE
jgi:hypothetical protein